MSTMATHGAIFRKVHATSAEPPHTDSERVISICSSVLLSLMYRESKLRLRTHGGISHENHVDPDKSIALMVIHIAPTDAGSADVFLC